MAFPLIAILASAALSDVQNSRAQGDSIQSDYANTLARINQTRAHQLGAQPYGAMVDDFRNRLQQDDIARQRSSNNNIGAMLQAYLSQSRGSNDVPQSELMGQDSDAGFAARRAARAVGDFAPNPLMSSGNLFDQTKPWMNDPWGDAGY